MIQVGSVAVEHRVAASWQQHVLTRTTPLACSNEQLRGDRDCCACIFVAGARRRSQQAVYSDQPQYLRRDYSLIICLPLCRLRNDWQSRLSCSVEQRLGANYLLLLLTVVVVAVVVVVVVVVVVAILLWVPRMTFYIIMGT